MSSAVNNWQERYLNTTPGRDSTVVTTEDVQPLGGDGVPDGFKYLDHFHIQDNN